MNRATFVSIALLIVAITGGVHAQTEEVLVTIERIYEDSETGQYIDRILTPEDQSYRFADINFVVVSDLVGTIEICYGLLNVNGIPAVTISARNLSDPSKLVTMFGPNGVLYEIGGENSLGLTGELEQIVNQGVMEIITLENGCDAVLALLLPAADIIAIQAAVGAAVGALLLLNGDDSGTAPASTPDEVDVDPPSPAGP